MNIFSRDEIKKKAWKVARNKQSKASFLEQVLIITFILIVAAVVLSKTL